MGGLAKCLAAEVDFSLSGMRVGRVLDKVAEEREDPNAIILDNGPEFTSRSLDQWAYKNTVNLAFIEPGKPQQARLAGKRLLSTQRPLRTTRRLKPRRSPV